MELKGLAEDLGLEEDEFLELGEIFTESSVSDCEKLQLAIEQEDVQKGIEPSHSLKGASGNLGFRQIYELAKGVEMNARNNSLEGAAGALKSIKGELEMIQQKG